MNAFLELFLRACAMGIGATLIMDLWNFLLARCGIESLNMGYLGRWIGHIRKGMWVHERIGNADPVLGEVFIGTCAHYAIGIVFAAIPILTCGLEWARSPTFLPALVTGIATVIAPYLILQPALGLGIASAHAPNPVRARMKSLASHAVYGCGLYFAARVMAHLGERALVQ